jgi:hypothetical protein
MKTIAFLSVLASVFVIGCGHKDEVVVNGADGSKVSMSQGPGGSTTFKGVGQDGSQVTETVNGNGGATIDATDKNGVKATEKIDANGISASDSKGDSYHMGSGAVAEADLGVPFYPGSSEAKDGMTAVTQDDKGKGAISSRTTKDDPAKVIEFYKDKIPGGKTSTATFNGTTMATISGKLASGAEISVTAQNDGKKDTAIMVTSQTKK